VKDDLDRWIFENRAQAGEWARRERIDDRALRPRRELEEIDSIDEAVEARAFGIEGDCIRSRQRGEALVRGPGVSMYTALGAPSGRDVTAAVTGGGGDAVGRRGAGDTMRGI
jgi:hypothetical protein